jgi:ketosteroid isomerase-like protein
MRKSSFLLAATVGCLLTVPVWAAAEADKLSDELRAVLRQHDEALNQHNLEAIMALYVDAPNIAMMGTGPGEFWRGREAVESAYQAIIDDFKAGSMSYECPESSAGKHGDVAWFASSCTMKDTTPDDESREYSLNVSGVLVNTADGWRYQMMHFSNLADADMPPPEEEMAGDASTSTDTPKAE